MSADGVHGTRDLNALLGSRICHDLISPLGAIGNGVELLEMSGFDATPELALISESVANANARIRFFRVAFGAAMPAQTVADGEVRQILEDLGKSSRMQVDWQVRDAMPRVQVKLAFLLLQCMESAMPFGGKVKVSGDFGGWTISGGSERLRPDHDLWSLLADPGALIDVSPAQVHFALVSDAARRAGRTVRTEICEKTIIIKL